MCRAFRNVSLALLMALTAGLTARPANASHNSPVSRAAECYRTAVKKFELLVIRTRYINKYDKRLVDDLEDSTSRLRSAARNERRWDRTHARFAETAALHVRVESVFFTRTLYPPNPQLEACWTIVSAAFADLEFHMHELPGHIGHQHAGLKSNYKNITRNYGSGSQYAPPNYIPNLVYESNYGPTLAPVPYPADTLPSPTITPAPPKVYTRTINVGALLQRSGQ